MRNWIVKTLLVALTLVSPNSAQAAGMVWNYAFESGATELDSQLSSTTSGSYDIVPLNLTCAQSGDACEQNTCTSSNDNYGYHCFNNSDCLKAGSTGTCWTETNNTFAATLQSGGISIGSPWLSSSTAAGLHFTIDLTQVSSTGPAKIVSMRESSNYGCFLELTTVVANDEYRLDLYHGDTNSECSGSANNETECTSCVGPADCTGGAYCWNGLFGPGFGACSNECIAAGSEGEQWCTKPTLGGIGGLKKGRKYEIYLTQDNNAGDSYQIECGLYVGGYNYAKILKTEGRCTGGSHAGYACTVANATATCTGGGSCTASTRKGNVTSIDLYKPGGLNIKFDDLAVYDSADTTGAYLRFEDIWPTSVTKGWSTQTGCSSTTFYSCVDDNCTPTGGTCTTTGSTPNPMGYDGANTYLGSGTAKSRTVDKYGLSNITTDSTDLTSGGVAVVAGQNSYAVMKGNAGGDHQVCETDVLNGSSTNIDNGPSQSTDVGGSSASWYSCGLSICGANSTNCDSVTDVNASQINMAGQKTSCQNNCGMDATAALSEVVIKRTPPPLPGILSDQNDDGIIAMCPIGDSVIDTAAWHAVFQGIKDVNSVMACTKGGTTLEAARAQISSILNGTTGGYLNCKYLKGTAAPCDYPFLVMGVNTMGFGLRTDNKYCQRGSKLGDLCTVDADCTGGGYGSCIRYATGYCRGGSNHGKPCAAPKVQGIGKSFLEMPYQCANAKLVYSCVGGSNPGTLCPVHNECTGGGTCTGFSQWRSPWTVLDCQSCSSNNDCDTNIPCTTGADCPTNGGSTYTCNDVNHTGTNSCKITCLSNGNCGSLSGTCASGSPGKVCATNTDCSGGVCGGLCVGGSNNGGTCVSPLDCPSGFCQFPTNIIEDASKIEPVSGYWWTGGIGMLCDGGDRAQLGCWNNTDCTGGGTCREAAPGCDDGICEATTSIAEGDRQFRELKAVVDNRHGTGPGCSNCAATLIVGAQPHGLGADNGMDFRTYFSSNLHKEDILQKLFIKAQQETGSPWVDLNAYFRDATNGQEINKYNDMIHHSPLGVGIGSDAVTQLVENRYGLGDGTCTSTKCTRGHVGKGCTTDRDCDRYFGNFNYPSWSRAQTALYKFDGNGNDYSLNAYNLTATGSPDFAETTNIKQGTNSVDFDGTAGQKYLTCTNANCPKLNITTSSISFGGYFNLTTLGSGSPTLISRWSANKGYKLTGTWISSSTYKPLCTIDGASTVNSPASAISGFHHIDCVYNGSTITLYVDGVVYGATGSKAGVITTNTNSFTINTSGATNGWVGQADEVYVTTKPLSVAGVNRVISTGIDGTLQACEPYTPSGYKACDSNTDCGCGSTTPCCDTGATAKDDTYCTEGSSAGCCMGRNSSSSYANGNALPACNAAP